MEEEPVGALKIAILEEDDLDNAIVPEGFTQEDFSRWMEKDVLEYL